MRVTGCNSKRSRMPAKPSKPRPRTCSLMSEETRLAHLDAVVNARTVDKLNKAIEATLALLCKSDATEVPPNQPNLTPPYYSDRIRDAISKALLYNQGPHRNPVGAFCWLWAEPCIRVLLYGVMPSYRTRCRIVRGLSVGLVGASTGQCNVFW